MSKEYKIQYSPLFYKDLEKIIDYIKNELKNKKAAENLFDEIMNEIEKRKYFPKAYEEYISNKKRKDVYYRIYVNNYVVFYVVKDEYIQIRRILYAKRSFEKNL